MGRSPVLTISICLVSRPALISIMPSAKSIAPTLSGSPTSNASSGSADVGGAGADQARTSVWIAIQTPPSLFPNWIHDRDEFGAVREEGFDLNDLQHVANALHYVVALQDLRAILDHVDNHRDRAVP